MCLIIDKIFIIKAIQFSVSAKKVKRKMWWQNTKMTLILIAVIVIILAAIGIGMSLSLFNYFNKYCFKPLRTMRN
jgi:hypothetical protein